jgi:hypothetical protein
MLSGSFYLAAVVMLLTAVPMAVFPQSQGRIVRQPSAAMLLLREEIPLPSALPTRF